jgi:hypothetical protein
VSLISSLQPNQARARHSFTPVQHKPDTGYSRYMAYRIQDTGYRIQDTGYGIRDTGFRIQDTGYRIQDTGYRIQNTV